MNNEQDSMKEISRLQSIRLQQSDAIAMLKAEVESLNAKLASKASNDRGIPPSDPHWPQVYEEGMMFLTEDGSVAKVEQRHAERDKADIKVSGGALVSQDWPNGVSLIYSDGCIPPDDWYYAAEHRCFLKRYLGKDVQ